MLAMYKRISFRSFEFSYETIIQLTCYSHPVRPHRPLFIFCSCVECSVNKTKSSESIVEDEKRMMKFVVRIRA